MFEYGLHNSTSLWNSHPIEINDKVQWTNISNQVDSVQISKT